MIYVTLKSNRHIIYETADTWDSDTDWIYIKWEDKKNKATGLQQLNVMAQINKDLVESVGFEKPTIRQTRKKK